MTDTIIFEMNNKNFIKAARGLRNWDRCIPMRGSFSAQAADVHSLWGVYKGRHKFRALGELHIPDEGFLLGVQTRDHGTVSVQGQYFNWDQLT